VDEAAQRQYTFQQRLMLRLAPALAGFAIRLIGRTLRLRLVLAPGATPDPPHGRTIYCMWHQCVLAAADQYRDRAMRIMISRSFDGELIARFAQKLGYIPVRGSSSRGGAPALLALHDAIQKGAIAVFTADGPRGPRHVAKPGAVLLARNTGAPLVAFHIALEQAWVVASWDALIIPKPFSRGVVYAERSIRVPPDADGDALQQYVAELQQRLDTARISAEQIITPGNLASLSPVG